MLCFHRELNLNQLKGWTIMSSFKRCGQQQPPDCVPLMDYFHYYLLLIGIKLLPRTPRSLSHSAGMGMQVCEVCDVELKAHFPLW